jgi:hypothetical protein
MGLLRFQDMPHKKFAKKADCRDKRLIKIQRG